MSNSFIADKLWLSYKLHLFGPLNFWVRPVLSPLIIKFSTASEVGSLKITIVALEGPNYRNGIRKTNISVHLKIVEIETLKIGLVKRMNIREEIKQYLNLIIQVLFS